MSGVVNLKGWQVGQTQWEAIVVEVEERAHAIQYDCGCIEWHCDDDNCKCEKVWQNERCAVHGRQPHYH